MTGAVQTPRADRTSLLLPDQDEFYESLAEVFIDGLKNARDVLESVASTLQGADRNKVLHLKQQIDNFLERLEKSKKLGVLGKIFKALGILGVIFSALMACLVPTPMTIALFVVSLALFIEPMIAGDDSIVQKGMSELMKALTEALGQAGGIAMAVLIFAVLAAVSMGLTARSISAAGSALSGAANGTSRFAKLVEKLPDMLRNLAKMELTPEQFKSLSLFLEGVEASISMARGGVQFPMAVLTYDVAKLMHAFEVDGALAEFISNMMTTIEEDVQTFMERIQILLNDLLEASGPQNP